MNTLPKRERSLEAQTLKRVTLIHFFTICMLLKFPFMNMWLILTNGKCKRKKVKVSFFKAYPLKLGSYVRNLFKIFSEPYPKLQRAY